MLDIFRLRSKLRCISSCETHLPAIPGRPFYILAGFRNRAVAFLWSNFVASKCLFCALTAYEIWATDYCFFITLAIYLQFVSKFLLLLVICPGMTLHLLESSVSIWVRYRGIRFSQATERMRMETERMFLVQPLASGQSKAADIAQSETPIGHLENLEYSLGITCNPGYSHSA